MSIAYKLATLTAELFPKPRTLPLSIYERLVAGVSVDQALELRRDLVRLCRSEAIFAGLERQYRSRRGSAEFDELAQKGDALAEALREQPSTAFLVLEVEAFAERCRVRRDVAARRFTPRVKRWVRNEKLNEAAKLKEGVHYRRRKRRAIRRIRARSASRRPVGCAPLRPLASARRTRSTVRHSAATGGGESGGDRPCGEPDDDDGDARSDSGEAP